jgi:hypothetical protein
MLLVAMRQCFSTAPYDSCICAVVALALQALVAAGASSYTMEHDLMLNLNFVWLFQTPC